MPEYAVTFERHAKKDGTVHSRICNHTADRMEVFRSGALGFITRQGKLVRAYAPGAWLEAWEVETEENQCQ